MQSTIIYQFTESELTVFAERIAQKTAEAIMAKQEKPEELMTRREAARFLHVCLKTIDNRINTGAIRAIKNGACVRIPKNQFLIRK